MDYWRGRKWWGADPQLIWGTCSTLSLVSRSWHPAQSRVCVPFSQAAKVSGNWIRLGGHVVVGWPTNWRQNFICQMPVILVSRRIDPSVDFNAVYSENEQDALAFDSIRVLWFSGCFSVQTHLCLDWTTFLYILRTSAADGKSVRGPCGDRTDFVTPILFYKMYRFNIFPTARLDCSRRSQALL